MQGSVGPVVLLLVMAGLCLGTPLPPACQDGRTNVQPTDCPYHVKVDKCGKQVCAKGPGEMCGGMYGR